MRYAALPTFALVCSKTVNSCLFPLSSSTTVSFPLRKSMVSGVSKPDGTEEIPSNIDGVSIPSSDGASGSASAVTQRLFFYPVSFRIPCSCCSSSSSSSSSGSSSNSPQCARSMGATGTGGGEGTVFAPKTSP